MMHADDSMEIQRKRHLVQMMQKSLLTREEVQQQAPEMQLEQEEQIEAPLVQNMEVHAEIDAPAPALGLILPVGGFLVLGCLIALMQWAMNKSKENKEVAKS